MSDASTADALPPFVPKPLPRSGYAEPVKVHRKVPFTNAVTFEGKSYAELYLRRLTVGQVRVCVDNAVEMRKRDPDAEFLFPMYVDAEENEIPEGVIDLLPDDEWASIRELSRDYIPQRFRPPPTMTETAGSAEDQPNESTPSSGETTAE